jgi:hypothetical protein
VLYPLGGIVVSVLATVPKGRRFKHWRGDGFLSAIKIRNTLSFRWDVKLDFPCREILRHVRDLLRYFILWQEELFSVFRPFLLITPDVSSGMTDRELWWTSQELFPDVIIIIVVSILKYHPRCEKRPVGDRSFETYSQPVIISQSFSRGLVQKWRNHYPSYFTHEHSCDSPTFISCPKLSQLIIGNVSMYGKLGVRHL